MNELNFKHTEGIKMTEAVNLNDLLDITLDDIADLPEFSNLAPGVYRVTIEFTTKKIGENPAVELKMKLIETVELSDPTNSEVQKPGLEASTAYQMNNEFGAGALKAAIKPLAAATGLTKLGEIFDAVKGMEALVVISWRTDKKDKEKHYMQVKSLTLV